MILRVILTPLGTHVAVDRVKTLGDRTGAINIGFFCDDNLQVTTPVPGFVCSAGSTHTSADDEDIAIFINCFSAHQ